MKLANENGITKKHFIKLADTIREHNKLEGQDSPFNYNHIATIARFCKEQNPHFNQNRWTDYIASECGPNGGLI